MRKFRNLVVEGLENRSMLAGNVAVSVSGNTLMITGDNLANGVSVQELDKGKYFVSGFALGGSNTTINGHTGGVVASQAIQGIHVVLNGGDDVFVMSNSKFRRDQLAADFSGGTAGTIPTSPVAPSGTTQPVTTRVYGNFYIDGGAGNDGIGYGARVGTKDANGNFISGVVHVIGGDGADRVIGDRTEAFDDMLFETGNGNDSVHADHARVGDFLFANLGGGNDAFSSTDGHGYHSQIYGEDGDDNIFVDDYHFDQEVFLNGGDGNNTITAMKMEGATAVQITTGSGADKINVSGSSTTGSYLVNTGSGNDSVSLGGLDVHLGTLSVALGDGNDTLRVGSSKVHNANFDGGAGDDSYFNDGNNSFDSVNKTNFEHNS
jgi:hypothetical protein